MCPLQWKQSTRKSVFLEVPRLSIQAVDMQFACIIIDNHTRWLGKVSEKTRSGTLTKEPDLAERYLPDLEPFRKEPDLAERYLPHLAL